MIWDRASEGLAMKGRARIGKAPKKRVAAKKNGCIKPPLQAKVKKGVLVCAEKTCSVKNKVQAVCDRIWNKKLEM
jgi:hypothetical protein